MSKKNRKFVKIKMPKEFLRFRCEPNGTTQALGYESWPDWAKNDRDPDKDIILFCSVHSEDEYLDYEKPIGRLTVIRGDEKDEKKGYPWNKDVYRLYSNDKGEVLQEKLISKNKRDHWMKKS